MYHVVQIKNFISLYWLYLYFQFELSMVCRMGTSYAAVESVKFGNIS
jgi:hypothetical protein